MVTIHFVDGDTKHSLQWTELLTVECEAPFESYEHLYVGQHVLAPWYSAVSGKEPVTNIQYAEAVVTDKLQSNNDQDKTDKMGPTKGSRPKRKPIIFCHPSPSNRPTNSVNHNIIWLHDYYLLLTTLDE